MFYQANHHVYERKQESSIGYYGRKPKLVAPQRRAEMIFIQHHEAAETADLVFQQFASLMDENHDQKWRVNASQRPPLPQKHHAFTNGFKQHASYYRSQPQPQPYTDITSQIQNSRFTPYTNVTSTVQNSRYTPPYTDVTSQVQNSRSITDTDVTSQVQNFRFTSESRNVGLKNNYLDPYEMIKPAFGQEEMIMDAYEAAKRFGGVLVIDYSNRK